VKGIAVEKSATIGIPNTKEYKLFIQTLNYNLKKRESEINKVILDLEEKGKPFTVDTIVESISKTINTSSVFSFTENLVKRFKVSGKNGNSAIYNSSLTIFKKFREEKDLNFEELNYKMLINFDAYLQKEKCKVNTISVYMRTLRAIYNKAIKEGVALKELYPFDSYKVKSEKTSKRAIIKGDITQLKNLDFSKKPDKDKARDYFLFSFYTRGMAFVDIAYLKVSNIDGDRLLYSRSKTNQKFTIKLTPQVMEIITKYNDLKNKKSYIFPIIIDPEGNLYTQYRNAMSLTNKKLKKIGEDLKLNIPLTTYVSRHSWATIAKREGVPTAVISEGLGHETERTTQIYLDSFENQVLDDANDLITNI
jgi:site-specific recombinase XerD